MTNTFALWLSAIATMAAAASAFFTWKTAREMEIQRQRMAEPTPLIALEILSNGLIEFVLRNLGPGVATNVRIEFEPRPVDHTGGDFAGLALFQRPLPYLHPGEEIRQRFGNGNVPFPEPKAFCVTLTYDTETGPGKVRKFAFELDALLGRSVPVPTTTERLEKLTREVEGVRLAVERIADSSDRT